MFLGPKSSPSLVHKRKQGRLAVRLHATLFTTTTAHAAILENLSRSGAKLRLEIPPPRGRDAVLRWDRFEAFGRVSWVTGSRCGLIFTSPLSEDALRTTLALNEASPAPEDAHSVSAAARAWVEGNGRIGLD
jgi:PilZ domain